MSIRSLVIGTSVDWQHQLLMRLSFLKSSRMKSTLRCLKLKNFEKPAPNLSVLLHNNNQIKYFNCRFKTNDSKSMGDSESVLIASSSSSSASGKTPSSAAESALKAAASSSRMEVAALPKTKEDQKLESASKEQAASPAKVLSATDTKKFELKTPAGVLTITTTIEDSKINEVVLEKTTPDGLGGKTKVISDSGGAIISKITSMNRKTVSKAMQGDEEGVSETVKQKSLNDLTKESVVKKSKKEPTLGTATIQGSKSKISAKPAKETINDEANVSDFAPDGGKRNEKSKKMPDAAEVAKKAEKLVDKVSRVAAAVSQSTSAAVNPASDAKPKPKRTRVDFNRSSLERNFITPNRAMSDFLLKPTDLDSLPKIKRRSPYEQEPPITVYWRKDVEAKAIEVWGSRENLLKETLKREVERKKHQQNLFTVKRRLREYRREIGYRTKPLDDDAMGLEGTSGRVVVIAIGINGLNFIFKVGAWLLSGSHSMFAEAIHSLADTTNQAILAYGIHKSVQMADPDHPYGYSNMRHVSSLISGVGIFCVGCGLSIYHGITGLLNPEPLQDLFWPFCILGGALVSEGATLLIAFNKLKHSARKDGSSLKDYILSGKDPCVNVVLTEDAAAVTSVIVAATCMGLSSITGNPIYDAVGSLLVGGILGSVASFIIYTNSSALVGKSISEDLLEKINSELESDCMIRAIYDVKGIHMGNSLIRYKAELDFDGRELSRYYLEKQDMNELFKLVKSFQSVEELEQFLLTHGENIVDLMGGEIDRIELKLRSKFPEIRHCDLEVL